MNLHDRFEQFEKDYHTFEKVENKRSTRRDIHAFILLNELCPDDGAIISAAEHDEYWLEINCDELNEKATDAQILELVRCGIRYDSEYDCLAVFA